LPFHFIDFSISNDLTEQVLVHLKDWLSSVHSDDAAISKQLFLSLKLFHNDQFQSFPLIFEVFHLPSLSLNQRSPFDWVIANEYQTIEVLMEPKSSSWFMCSSSISIK